MTSNTLVKYSSSTKIDKNDRRKRRVFSRIVWLLISCYPWPKRPNLKKIVKHALFSKRSSEIDHWENMRWINDLFSRVKLMVAMPPYIRVLHYVDFSITYCMWHTHCVTHTYMVKSFKLMLPNPKPMFHSFMRINPRLTRLV